MNYVLDACAVIAFLRNEPGAEVVEEILLDASATTLIHAINLTEVYYDFLRSSDERTAKAMLKSIDAIGVKVRRDISKRFLLQIGNLKGTIRKVSLADCFCIALANNTNSTILTSDRREFSPLANDGLCKVKFIR